MGYEVFIPYHYIILISSPFIPGILFHDSSYLDQDKSQEHYFLQLLYWTAGDRDFSWFPCCAAPEAAGSLSMFYAEHLCVMKMYSTGIDRSI